MRETKLDTIQEAEAILSKLSPEDLEEVLSFMERLRAGENLTAEDAIADYQKRHSPTGRE